MEKERSGMALKNTACFKTFVANPNNIWQSDNVLVFQLPNLAIQIAFIVLASRFFYYVLRPFNQPRLVGEIFAGFILSPAVLGGTKALNLIYDIRGILHAETISHLGLIFYVFLTGLEMNLDVALRARTKVTSIAVAGTVIPMILGMSFFAVYDQLYLKPSPNQADDSSFKAYVLWSTTLTVTGFPILAHILADLKLLYTGLGRAALTAAMINDIYNWVLFIVLIPFAVNGEKAIYSVLTTVVLFLCCYYVVRPYLVKLIARKTDQNEWGDYQLCFVLMGAFTCATITDLLGTHEVVGAFIFGLIIPHGKFTDMLIEKTDDFASGLMAPLFFAGFGMKLNLMIMEKHENRLLVLVLVVLLCSPKILSTLLTTNLLGMQTRDGIGLGLLMNTKGILSLIILNIAWNERILSADSYSIMVSAILVMTIIVSPITNAIYKPRKRFQQNKLRTIQMLRVDAELRVLACVHNTRHATGMINILAACNATRVSPLQVFALHLVELTGRSTALLAAHIEQPNYDTGAQNQTKSQAEWEGISRSFQDFAQDHDAFRVETLTAVSTYGTIHEDISNVAEEKRTSLIILPFHKQTNEEGALEETHAAYEDINKNVLQDAPCSVAIFVDRGLGSLSKINLHVLMLFIGGPDDREALAIAWRMAGHSGIQLSMVRIILVGEAAEVDTTVYDEAHGLLSAIMDAEKQKELDDEFVSSFRLRAVNNKESITYSETEVHNGDGIHDVLNDLDQNRYDLYILGQGKGRNSMALSALLEWCDCPELGVIGDIVASNTFGSHSSVLVVQQYGFGGMVFNNNNRNDGSEELRRHPINNC